MHTLRRLAQIVRAELVGNPDAVVNRANSFYQAVEGDVTFAETEWYLERINSSAATAIIVSSAVSGSDRNLLVASNPKLAFARAIEALHEVHYQSIGVSGDVVVGPGTVLGKELSIHPRVTIGRDAVIGNRVTLHPGVVIGDRCRIGDDTVIYANVSIYADCDVGSNVVVHAGTVIGADGFGFVPDEAGHQVRLRQLGRVRIEDDCDIGANCTIDRGGFEDTILRRGVKLDNLIQVGHSTEIGDDTVVAALTGFSGGTHVGQRCIIAGQAGTNQHITIGDGAVISGRTAVTKKVGAGAAIAGMGQNRGSWRRSQVLFSRLPELAERISRLEKAIREAGLMSEKAKLSNPKRKS